MDYIDLNEENYDYNKLLELFSLHEYFTLDDLKEARKKVLMLHPDKSGLNVKYFLFFSKMFKKVQEIYAYTHHETNANNLKRQIDNDDTFKRYLEKNKIDPKKNYKRFSQEFNKMFDTIYISENSEGYSEWLKSNDAMYDMNDLEGSRRKAIEQKALVETRQDIEEVGLGVDGFSRLKCFDLKESHSNPIFAMDVEKEYQLKPKFNSVQEYQQFLGREDKKNQPIGLSQSKQLLQQREQMLHQQAKHMAYENMKQSEKMKEKYQKYISTHLRLEN